MLLADYTRWAVLWVVKRKGGGIKLKVKDFGDDFVGATEYYERKRDKPFATLLSKNVGWAPPKRYRPYEEWQIVTRRGKRFKKRVRTVPLDTLNGEGWFWCPYCRKLRRFVQGAEFPGSQHEVLKCQICGIHHRDNHVRRWNPQLARIPDHIEKRRARGGGAKRRRRSR